MKKCKSHFNRLIKIHKVMTEKTDQILWACGLLDRIWKCHSNGKAALIENFTT